ncbi:serine hydroxymethyltransferase [Actinoplanes sp. NEAU-A12]|uniref:Serine hydroxymethyltransferase n=1 Tax=Actinoplanes sandaracinus TaxID=3045177 RepID=A0ABT6WTB2_9ACTN|nr:serine hydroxymethyltransferase [Actinoplanes sandaracinus]MDI6102984.1 serine hydroxymethyltransferase [Actinoplanes sandaracinus]
MAEGILAAEDAELYGALNAEHDRQRLQLTLAPAATLIAPSVLACLAYPALHTAGHELSSRPTHAQVEALAASRAEALFGAEYADVRPASATQALELVLTALLEPHDAVMDLRMAPGPALGGDRPGARRWVGYGLTDDGSVDHEAAAALAREHRPRVILCGGTSHPRATDFARFRRLADEIDALLVADISAVTGLVAAGLHDSPVERAHVTVADTHRQLGGPRGGVIMTGPDGDTLLDGGNQTLSQVLRRAGDRGARDAVSPATVAAKARALTLAGGESFRTLMATTVANAAALAGALLDLGHRLVTGGTDTDLVTIELTGTGIGGRRAERVLAEAGIVVTATRVPTDSPGAPAGGLALGSTVSAQRGMGDTEMRRCAELVHMMLRGIPAGDEAGAPDQVALRAVRAEARALAGRLAHTY